jgi:hypothetical protein
MSLSSNNPLIKCARCEKYTNPALLGLTATFKEVRACEFCGWKIKEARP